MPKVACPAHQVYHKESKKCVDIGGPEFQKILEKDLFAFDSYTSKIEKFFAKNNMNAKKDKCPPNKVYNKHTKRCVIIYSQSYNNALTKDHLVFADQKDKIKTYAASLTKTKTHKALLIHKPTVAPKKNANKLLKKVNGSLFNNFLNNNINVEATNKNLVGNSPKPNVVPKKNVNVVNLKNKKKVNQIFTKLIKSKIKNVPSKYLNKKVKGEQKIENLPMYEKRTLNYSLPYRKISLNDIIKNVKGNLSMYTLNYDVVDAKRRYYENVLNIDITKGMIDMNWWKKSILYIDGLSPRQKWSLRGYSFKGDVYLNLMERKMSINWLNFDLSPFVYEFFDMVINDGYKFYGFDKDVISKALKDNDSKNIEELMKKFLKNVKLFNVSVKKLLVQKLNKTLSNVIKNAPAVTKTMTVYRGVKDSFFTKSDYKNNKVNEVYLNKGYVSTSTNWSKSLSSFTGTSCCFSVITLLPGTRCLPIMGLSQFAEEAEILLNKDTKFLIRRKFKAAKPTGIGSMKFSHIIAT